MSQDNGSGALNQDGDINALVDEKINADTDFQSSLEVLSDEEKAQTIADKKAELLKEEYSSLADKAKKAEELANNYKIRAEKAEKGKKEPETAPKAEYSQEDTIALIRAEVADEDMAYVKKFATLENVSVAQALKSKELQEILNVKKEQRKTVEATNTAPVRRGSQKISDDALLEKARNNEDVDVKEVARARMEAKLAKLKK